MRADGRAARPRATAERVRGAPQPDSQRFPTIFRRSASINIRWACVGRGYGPRRRRAPLWPRRHGVALGPKPLRLGATGTELQRAAGQRRPFEPLGRGVTAGGPPGAHTSQDLACPRLILKRGVRATVASAPAFGNPEAICLTLTKAKFTHVLMASDESTRSRTKHAVRRTSKRHAMGM